MMRSFLDSIFKMKLTPKLLIVRNPLTKNYLLDAVRIAIKHMNGKQKANPIELKIQSIKTTSYKK